MKKSRYLLWCGWCILGAFLSPHWLVLTYLNVAGLIYKYDSTMDTGTAGVFGIMFLIMWVLLVLLPTVLFLNKMKRLGMNKVICAVLLFALSSFLCIAFSGWNIVAFWTN